MSTLICSKQTYRGARFGELSLYLFAVADAAHGPMINDGINQSILVSGESGVVKTESTKLLMIYLAYMGGRVSVAEDVVPSAVPSSMEPLAVEKRTGINNSPQFPVTKLLTNLDRSNTRVHPKPSNVKKSNARNHTEKHNVNNGSSTSSALQKSTTGVVSKPKRSTGTSNLQHKDIYHPWKMIEFYCK
ncbi:hypothetical protein KIW84_070033 [Lathyrus oleraceus]|uniref:Myosin motor domain-containing protein n=1 Tax=Pisum sativum TaxID=3888 RepID=A0A9D4VF66_PEA|nr:hypothetical protein KIW84_070033 [Pisum sativum]